MTSRRPGDVRRIDVVTQITQEVLAVSLLELSDSGLSRVLWRVRESTSGVWSHSGVRPADLGGVTCRVGGRRRLEVIIIDQTPLRTMQITHQPNSGGVYFWKS